MIPRCRGRSAWRTRRPPPRKPGRPKELTAPARSTSRPRVPPSPRPCGSSPRELPTSTPARPASTPVAARRHRARSRHPGVAPHTPERPVERSPPSSALARTRAIERPIPPPGATRRRSPSISWSTRPRLVRARGALTRWVVAGHDPKAVRTSRARNHPASPCQWRQPLGAQ